MILDTPLAPRPYQEEALGRLMGESRRGVPSTLLVLPTGCGKTVTFGHVARRVIDAGGRAPALAHREELLGQAVRSLSRVGVDAALRKAGHGRGTPRDGRLPPADR